MGFWAEIGIGVRSLSIVWAVIIGLWLLKVAGMGLALLIERVLLPTEIRALQWLQDRAMSRALHIDIDIIRARRKIETAAKPIKVHGERPIRY